jgi:hypothetical protein
VVRPEPDFALTVASDRFVVAPGKPLDIPVTVVRRNGFKEEVELLAEGLPPGITATRPDSKTASLRLTAEKTGTAGAFHIVGKVKGQPDRVRQARATLADLATATADLWVTAPGK